MDKKFDKLDALILLAGDVLIEEELAYARDVLDPELVISKRTNRRILNYIRHTQKKPGYHPVLNTMKRIAVIVLVLGTVLFASAMSIEAVREKFWNAIVEWYEDYIAVMFVDEDAEDTMMDAEFEVREPSYLPDGVVKGELIQRKFSCSISYCYNDQTIIYWEQLIAHENYFKIDNSNCALTDININGHKGIWAEYKDQEQNFTVVWEDDYYRYNIIIKSNILSRDEILKMASSIY